MTGPDPAGIETALAAVARTQRQLNETERTLAEQTQRLGDQVGTYGADHRRADIQIDHELVRRLYWDAPSLHNKIVADAFGLRSPNDVPTIAGSREFDLPCISCGTRLHHVVKNRTELADLRRTNRSPHCAEVAADSDRRRRAQDAAERRLWDMERSATLRRAMVAYVLDHPDMLDDTGDAGFHLDIPVPEWGVSTVSLADLNAVRREVATARLSPRLGATD